MPAAVRAGAEGDATYFLLGGICGLLPDTLDFKFVRFFARREIEVSPDPLHPDPRLIAEAVAEAIGRAHIESRPVAIKLNSIRLGADAWQQYAVHLDVARQRVRVTYGPVVDTGRNPTARPTCEAEGAAPLPCPVTLDYEATTTVDILDGPLFRMEPAPGGRVIPRFIPWHRQWSHSLITAGCVGAGCALLWGAWAGVVACAAWAAHALLDQLGFMGASFWYPIRKTRAPGLGLTHSSQGLPNLAAVWLACLLIFWNLYRAGGASLPRIGAARYWAIGAGVPAAAAWAARRRA